MNQDRIRVEGARQNNLKNLSLDLPLNKLIVISGLSGSGKSSLAFDTVYAEGQRRYVETFSAYTRQFLDRMDKPRVDRIDGVPPAIAIDQTNPVRTSRSTVGTMTELNDHLKLLFARAARLYCSGCGREVKRDDPESIFAEICDIFGKTGSGKRKEGRRALIVFPVRIPSNFSEDEVKKLLARQGYQRVPRKDGETLIVIQDRLKIRREEKSRIIEDLEAALHHGRGKLSIIPVDDVGREEAELKFSSDLHCPHCNIHYRDPVPNMFSFNSPIGACETCRGFGRVIGIDYNLVVPDDSKSLKEGAVRPWQSDSFREVQEDLLRFARKRKVPTDKPWRKLSERQREWVLHGEGDWEDGLWYGVDRFFAWLESKSYRMHIRVLLSKYRTYRLCPDCGGARLNPESLLWRLGSRIEAPALVPAKAGRRGAEGNSTPTAKYGTSTPITSGMRRADGPDNSATDAPTYSKPRVPAHNQSDAPATAPPPAQTPAAAPAPGYNIHDLALMPIGRLAGFMAKLSLSGEPNKVSELLLEEIRTRLSYLNEVGLSYLNLNRQSRTLSGGEVQRINLTTALGTSLVNTLFVLDEPSIGLHSRDIGRLISVLKKLRDAGNTILVVEHDPEIIRAADVVLEMGPGAGSSGGEMVYSGPIAEFLKKRDSLTAAYVSGRKRVYQGAAREAPPPEKTIRIVGAAEHNLKAIDVTIPLGRFVCISGVSGSGKSTLVEDVLYRALLRKKKQASEEPGKHEEVRGDREIDDVILVDQSPIGKTTRSNPATYVGALNPIRELFAVQPLAKERAYTAGTFSFNSKKGQCPTCKGSGFEHIEMQFLSDIYLRCPECGGKRFRDEVLDVKISAGDGKEAMSIHDILEMTVKDAQYFFTDEAAVLRKIEPLANVGLDYIRLGQAVPTLSGGEAQRLKLAGHLTEKKGKALFLFDEPTTGLHFDDIATLLDAFRSLVDAGHSVLVIEHNLDVLGAADWIIDLGPEGGEAGGELVHAGSPASLKLCEKSHTGSALRNADAAGLRLGLGEAGGRGETGYADRSRSDQHRAADEAPEAASPQAGEAAEAPESGSPQAGESAEAPESGKGRAANASPERGLQPAEVPEGAAAATMQARRKSSSQLAQSAQIGAKHQILIRNAREHNLRGIDLSIPRDALTVITGISGSGKSTVAFDILFSEGQRRYLESLNAYARQFVQPASRPDVDGVSGVPPTVAIEQRSSRGGLKSTVATVTELYHYIRLLFVKLGVQHCPDCGIAIRPETEESIVHRILKEFAAKKIEVLAPLVQSRKGYYTDLAKWALKKGFTELRVDGEYEKTENWPRLSRYKEHNIEAPIGKLKINKKSEEKLSEYLKQGLSMGNGSVKVLVEKDPRRHEEVLFSTERSCPRCGRSFPELDPRLFSFNSKQGWCPKCYGMGRVLPGFDAEQTGEEEEWRPSPDGEYKVCPLCEGKRLKAEALAVKFHDKGIDEITAMTVDQAAEYFQKLQLQTRETEIARDIRAELASRLSFLSEVGLSYLSLDRAAPSLSGGEAQRIRLAAQLGSNLRGVCYILDEPTIGLHVRDHNRLMDSLAKLKENGNTVVIVEHDEDTIRRADHIIDLGPGGGKNGGDLVFAGDLPALLKSENSITGKLLREPLRHIAAEPSAKPVGKKDERAPETEEVEAGAGAARDGAGKTDAESTGQAEREGKAFLRIQKANLHNLKDLNISFPLASLICVTGVSGSGKSSLVREVLYKNLKLVLGKPRRRGRRVEFSGCSAIEGWEQIEKSLEVDQSPIGKTPRSSPATYVGFWTEIRKLFASIPEARVRGYTASRFSFNVKGGRCEACKGQGYRKIEMNFLPDVHVPCEVCEGKRFNTETLEVRFKEKNIADVLEMSVDEAVEFFSSQPAIHKALSLMQEVGLGYLHLGQQSPSLSGGEAQRIKLITELAKSSKGKNLYVLDEPTIGLHMADVAKLISVLKRLSSGGNTVIVIEHNLDLIAEADWIIDLGPEGGEGGGAICAQGPPSSLRDHRNSSYTARYLADFLKRHG